MRSTGIQDEIQSFLKNCVDVGIINLKERDSANESQLEMIIFPRGHLVRSRDTFGCHNLVWVGKAIGI